MLSVFKKFLKFYKASEENRMQFYLLLAFIVVPIVGMSLLYIWISVFWL